MPTANERQADRKILRALTEAHGERKETLNDIRTKINAIAKEFGVKVRPVYDNYIDAGIAHINFERAITFAELMLENPSSHDDKKVLSGIYKVLVHCFSSVS